MLQEAAEKLGEDFGVLKMNIDYRTKFAQVLLRSGLEALPQTMPILAPHLAQETRFSNNKLEGAQGHQ